jgi:pimeloyl-ACP methyl ester carboxylesterase
VRRRVRANMVEAFRQGWQGAAHDLTIYSTDWGFDVGDIRIPVSLWYGEKDQNVSLNMGKYYAARIPKSTLKVYKGEGHLIAITHAEEILHSFNWFD